MRDIRYAVDRLLLTEGTFATRHLAQALALSSNRAAVHLRRLVETRELERVGDGRRTRYARGPGWGVRRSGVMRGGAEAGFWHQVAEQLPSFGYVEMIRLGTKLIRRAQVTQALDDLRHLRYIVLDFDGVESVSDAFADEALIQYPLARPVYTVAINMSDAVRAKAKRALLIYSDPRPGYWDDDE